MWHGWFLYKRKNHYLKIKHINPLLALSGNLIDQLIKKDLNNISVVRKKQRNIERNICWTSNSGFQKNKKH